MTMLNFQVEERLLAGIQVDSRPLLLSAHMPSLVPTTLDGGEVYGNVVIFGVRIAESWKACPIRLELFCSASGASGCGKSQP